MKWRTVYSMSDSTHLRNDTLLHIEGLSVDYGARSCVQEVTIPVARGSIVGLVGESGSGKSTVLRAVAHLLPSDAHIRAGRIMFQGADLVTLPESDMVAIRGKHVATIFQNPGSSLDPSMRIGAQVTEVIRQHTGLDKRQAHTRALDLLERMRLPEAVRVMRAYPFELSGGMQQRVAIALAMAFEPAVILADEPTSSLDTTTQREIIDEIVHLTTEHATAVLLVTHNIALAYHVCDDIHVMESGRIIESGTARTLIEAPQAALTRRLVDAVPRLCS